LAIEKNYQIVRVILKSSKVLNQHKVVISELLMLGNNEYISILEIDRTELENKH
jgi:hypothetical protein